MKKQLLLIMAMLFGFAFAMPALATEILGFAPVESRLDPGSGDATSPMLPTGDKSIKSERRFGSQLEAADIVNENNTRYAMIGGGFSNAQWPNGSGAKHEVGWQG